jgi:hypothetical protein
MQPVVFQTVSHEKKQKNISIKIRSLRYQFKLPRLHQLSTTKPALCGLCRIWTSAKPGTRVQSMQAIELDNPGNALPTHKKGRHDVVLFRTRIHQNQ